MDAISNVSGLVNRLGVVLIPTAFKHSHHSVFDHNRNRNNKHQSLPTLLSRLDLQTIAIIQILCSL
jgi:hypothetical protein